MNEVEADTAAKATAAEIGEAGFLYEAHRRFPDVSWRKGPPVSRDEYGNPYVTLVLGGARLEGCEYPAQRFTTEGLWDAWWAEVAARMAGVREVQVRAAPVVTHGVDYVFDQFDRDRPYLTPRPWFQIFSRLSFVK